MTFKMDGEYVLPASREDVWRKLNDPEVLQRCIEGCEKFEKTDENSYAARVKVKIGAVKAAFNGKIDLSDLDPPNRYRIEGQGEGGAAGFAKGGAVVALSDVEEGTRLHYTVEATIGGRLAQMGGRLIQGVSKKQADQFFKKFAAEFGVQTDEEEAKPLASSAGESPAAPVAQADSAAPASLLPSFSEYFARKPVLMTVYGAACILLGLLIATAF